MMTALVLFFGLVCFLGGVHIGERRSRAEVIRLKGVLNALHGAFGRPTSSPSVRFVGETEDAFLRRLKAGGR